MTMPWPEPALADKRWHQVLRRRFDRAADGYERLARAQKHSADDLLRSLEPQGLVLDVGCGSGYLARQLAASSAVDEVLALDISEGMLRAPAWREPCPAGAPRRLCADAARLPLADGCVDMLVSNFALHWCPGPPDLMRELRRVMRLGGEAGLVIPVAGSLAGRGDAAARGASLRLADDWRSAARAGSWAVATEGLVDYVEFHPDADAWLQALRAMGVTARRGTGLGLSGRAALVALRDRLEATREHAGIPLRYQTWRASLRAI